MPVYEFRCNACQERFSTLIGMTAQQNDTRCPYCGSTDTGRMVSRFARVRTEDDRMDNLADELDSMGEPGSSGEMRHALREVGKALDEDVADNLEEMFESDMESED